MKRFEMNIYVQHINAQVSCKTCLELSLRTFDPFLESKQL